MIRRIQALNYRCLRYADIPLGERQVLVGPNGAGKSTLIDILAFLRDFVRHGPLAAVEERADEFRDLVWGRPADAPGFELAVEFELPAECRDELPAERGYRTYRYEVALRGGEGGVGIHAERGILAPLPRAAEGVQPFLFPDLPEPPETILAPARPGAHTVLSKSPGGRDRFYTEQDPAKGWVTEVALGPHRSTLGGLPESPETVPASTAIKRILETRITRLRPDAAAMKRPSPPGLPDDALLEDGSNLPWVVRRLRDRHREDFSSWLTSLRGAVPGLTDIRFARRTSDRYGYLVLRYGDGLDAPSWIVSDGTLRLLALTLPAFLPPGERILLVEEPERGLHPGALGTLHAALSAIPGSQLLATTHSPALQALFRPDEVLSCDRREDGAVGISPGAPGGDDSSPSAAGSATGGAPPPDRS